MDGREHPDITLAGNCFLKPSGGWSQALSAIPVAGLIGVLRASDRRIPIRRKSGGVVQKSEKEKYTGVRKAYVTQNASEYFAESYRDYVLSGSNLKKSMPKTYAYVRNAVQTIQNSPDRITKIKNVYKVIWKKNG